MENLPEELQSDEIDTMITELTEKLSTCGDSDDEGGAEEDESTASGAAVDPVELAEREELETVPLAKLGVTDLTNKKITAGNTLPVTTGCCAQRICIMGMGTTTQHTCKVCQGSHHGICGEGENHNTTCLLCIVKAKKYVMVVHPTSNNIMALGESN